MAQMASRFCPQCGTQVPVGQRFCSNCGTVMDADMGKPTAMSSNPNNASYPGIPDMSTQMAMSPTNMPTQEGTTTPPPPPPQSFTPAPPQQPVSYPNYSSQNNQSFAQQAPPTIQQPPAYAKPQKDSSKKILGQIGCGMLFIILAVLAICGVSGYFAVRWVGSLANSVPTTTTGNGSTGTGNGVTGNGVTGSGSTPTITTVSQNMNATVTYASVTLNFTGVKEASSFTDDSNGNSPVLLRINFGERNPTTGTVFVSYGDNFRLILPDGTSVVPGNEQNNGAIDQAVNRTNWIDFPLSSSVAINKLILRVGAPSEAQMDIPLVANPDVSKYQDTSITPNSAFQYANLNWTLTSVTSSLSAHGKQATTGNRYITVAFKIDNPTANTFFPSPGSYMRLQAGSVVNPPDSYSDSINGAIAPGTTGTTGTVTFLMPQNGSAFTLTMLARTDVTPPATQVTQTFHI